MADIADVARLRRLVSEPTEASYTDAALVALIDELGIDLSAARIWREKAASYADLVDTTEGSSSRKLSQLQGQALAMASNFEASAGGDTASPTSRPRSRPIVRG